MFRSKSTGFEEEKMDPTLIPPPQTVWEPSMVRGADPGPGDPRVAEAQGRGRLEAGGG
jgi:hypothetical protein